MHCHGCGAEVVEHSVYCHKCGARLAEGRPDDKSPNRGGHVPTGGSSTPVDEYPSRLPPGPESRDTPPGEMTPIDTFKQAIGATRHDDDEPETHVWEGAYCLKAMIGKWILCGLITLALLVGGIMGLAKDLSGWAILLGVTLIPWAAVALLFAYRHYYVRYQLTTQRLIHEMGILRRRIDRIETIDMDDITYEQKLLERLVGVGSIRITSSDRTHPELLLEGIADVKEVAGKIDDIRRGERRRRGLHIENI